MGFLTLPRQSRLLCISVSTLFLWTSSSGAAQAESRAAEAGTAELVLGRTGVVAFLLAAIYLLSPRIRPHVQRVDPYVSSAGGGMATAYVFMDLIPEINAGEHLLGRRINVVTLLGFLIYYGVKRWLERRSTRDVTERVNFGMRLLHLFVYSWLVIYAMPEEIKTIGFHTLPLSIALVLHLLHQDYCISSEYPVYNDAFGRYILAVAPLLAFAMDIGIPHPNVGLMDSLTALMAGAVMFNVFGTELASHETSRIKWFVAGVVGYVGLILLAE